jgi:hypothetical protein
MLEILFGLLPLIFVCSAIGVILLNFEAVAMYIVYVLSMLFRPKELLNATSLTPLETTTKFKFTPFTPFIRLWTLFRVLFFPNIEFDAILSKKKPIATEEQSFLSQNAAKTAAKFSIKTYTAVNEKDHSNFRNSYEPIVGPNLSSEFKKAFPQLSEKALPFAEPKPEPIILPISETIATEIPTRQMNDPVSMSISEVVADEKHEVILPTTTESFTNEKPIAQQQPDMLIGPQISEASVETPQPTPPEPPKPMAPVQAAQELPSVKDSSFDAIAALEAKVNKMKETQIKSMPSENTSGISHSIVSPDQTILPTSESKLNLDMSKIHAPVEAPPPPPAPARPSTESLTKNITSFHSGAGISGISKILPLIFKFGLYGFLSLPLLVVVGSIIVYMVTIQFDFGQAGSYPKWVSNGIENFVKNNVISKTQK